jgi:uncharacterized protein (TIGR03435 family)
MTPAAFLIAWIVRSAALLIVSALLLRLLRVTNPSLRLAAWTALLIGSLAIPFLTTALPQLPIGLLPHHPAATIASPALDFTNPSNAPAININIASTTPPPAPTKPIDWMQLVLILYATIATALLARLLIGLWLSLGILRRSSPTGLPASRADIRESHEIESPVTAGIIRSAILLPQNWRAWDATRLNAVLAHESSHVRRRDPTVQFLSSLHCALLWISPATWLLHRAIIRTGEEISDEDAITATPDRTTYVEILLDFMQRRARANPVEVAMARYDQPKTRIRRILNATAGAHRATRAGIASTLAIIVPLSCLAAVVYPKHPPATRIEAPPAIPIATPLPKLAQVTAPPLPSPPPAPEKRPQFEVATIKPAPQGGMMGVKVFPGGRVVIQHFPLKTLVQTAFQRGYWQIEGGETWTQTEEYTLEAKPSEAEGARIQNLRYSIFTIDDPTLRRMLQALLIDRFHLKFHLETRTGNVLLLERNNKKLLFAPPEIRVSEEAQRMYPENFSSIGYVSGKWSIFQTSMAQLATFAGDMVFHAPVIDRTGIPGHFEYRQPAPDLDPKYSGDLSASFTDFLQNAGLKLERSKGPVEYFVIDHAEKPSAD